jgi:putative DNA primase/helicase
MTSAEYAARLEEHLKLETPASRVSLDADVAPEFSEDALSEDALALRFSSLHPDLRYTDKLKTWHRWTGTYWKADSTLQIYDEIRASVREVSNVVAEWKDKDGKKMTGAAKRIASAATTAAVERLAKSDRRHSMEVEEWDTRLDELCTPTGTVELTSGELRPADPLSYHTKITAVGPAAGTPQLWLSVVRRAMGSDDEMVAFLKRALGSCMGDSTRDQSFLVFFGSGGNSKDTILETVSNLLGDYAAPCPDEVITAHKNNMMPHPTGLDSLRGLRLTTFTETEAGTFLAESRIKRLTGGNRMKARKMHTDYSSFQPHFRIILATNNKPQLQGVDEAMKRRVKMVHFNVTIPAAERDLELKTKLKCEWPMILQWCIDGYREWLREGLNPPEKVTAFTNDFIDEQDVLGRWMNQCCVTGVQGKQCTTFSIHLFSSWKEWCEQNNERVGSLKSFSMSLEKREGLRRVHTRAGRSFHGIGLKSDWREESQ